MPVLEFNRYRGLAQQLGERVFSAAPAEVAGIARQVHEVAHFLEGKIVPQLMQGSDELGGLGIHTIEPAPSEASAHNFCLQYPTCLRGHKGFLLVEGYETTNPRMLDCTRGLDNSLGAVTVDS